MIEIDTVNTTQPMDMIDQYKDVFEGLGCLEGELDPSVSPGASSPERAAQGQTRHYLD